MDANNSKLFSEYLHNASLFGEKGDTNAQLLEYYKALKIREDDNIRMIVIDLHLKNNEIDAAKTNLCALIDYYISRSGDNERAFEICGDPRDHAVHFIKKLIEIDESCAKQYAQSYFKLKKDIIYNSILCNIYEFGDIDTALSNLNETGNDINYNGFYQNKNTLLHTAIIRGDLEIIELFIEYGANPNLRNISGETPLDLARRLGDREDFVNYLLKVQRDKTRNEFNNDILSPYRKKPRNIFKNIRIKLISVGTMFQNRIWSISKLFRLKRIARILTPAPDCGESIARKLAEEGLDSFSRRFEEMDACLADLFALVREDPITRNLINYYRIDMSGLQDIYEKLVINGAGIYKRGHWIPASALAYGPTLEYILKNKDIGDADFKEICYRLRDYFNFSKIGDMIE